MSGKSIDEVEDERLRQTKLEETFEIQSLRRIICAYLNYGDAAEEDVKWYEHSFRKLPPRHKALLSHYPRKFKSLRRCISANTYFIYNMLQTFEPPFDMCEDLDAPEHTHMETAKCECPCPDSSNGVIGPPDAATVSCLTHVEGTLDKDLSVAADCCGKVHGEEANSKADMRAPMHELHSNGNAHSVPCDCSDHYPKYTVPLVDVDKVRCVVRNIVRGWAAEGQKERDQCYKPILEELDRLFPGRTKESPPSCLVPGAGLGLLALEISCSVRKKLDSGQSILGSIAIAILFLKEISFALFQFLIYFQLVQGLPKVSLCVGVTLLKYTMILVKKVWINFGPLLYHFADMYGQDEMSIELSVEDLKKVVLHYGFQIEKESTVETTYTTNTRSMMQNRYFTAFWTMRKMPTESWCT